MHLSKISLALRQWGAAGFSPLSLFASGEQGAWYDPSDLSTMFQDSAGTTPVTTDGQSVGKILDKSGRGNHASQATAAARPLYKTDGTYHWLQFDGVDDSLSTAAIDFTMTDSMSVFAGFYKASDAGTGILVELSSNSNTNNGVFALIGPSASGGSDLLYRSKGTVNSSTTITSVLSSVKYVSANMSKISTDLFEMRLNGVSRQSLATDQGSGNYGNYIMYIGMRGSASAAFIGNLYPLIIRGALSDAQQITDVETWINRKTGAY